MTKDLDPKEDNMDSTGDLNCGPGKWPIHIETTDRPSKAKDWKFCPHCGKKL